MESRQLSRLIAAVEALADVVERLSRDIARGQACREALEEVRAELAALRRDVGAGDQGPGGP